MGYVWLEMLSEADKNDGRIKGNRESIARGLTFVSLANRPRSTIKHILIAIQLMVEYGWIEERTDHLLVRNYLNYHRVRGPNKSLSGFTEAPPLSVPVPEPIRTVPKDLKEGSKELVGSSDEKRQADPSSGNHQPIWPEELKEVHETLVKLEVLEFFNDPLYWKRVEEITNNTRVFYLDELGKCVLHFSSKGNQAPRSIRGWKMAFTTWVKRALTWEDRRGAQEGFDASRTGSA